MTIRLYRNINRILMRIIGKGMTLKMFRRLVPVMEGFVMIDITGIENRNHWLVLIIRWMFNKRFIGADWCDLMFSGFVLTAWILLLFIFLHSNLTLTLIINSIHLPNLIQIYIYTKQKNKVYLFKLMEVKVKVYLLIVFNFICYNYNFLLLHFIS